MYTVLAAIITAATAFTPNPVECQAYPGGYACAPVSERHGDPITVYEDGSATYSGGIVYDTETGEFH